MFQLFLKLQINLLAKKLTKIAIEKQKTISVCESCTGGLLASYLTKYSGSSKFFLGGIIVYSNQVKEKNLNISKEILNKYGAVSKETAEKMSQNSKKLFSSDYCLAITGIAGPSRDNSNKKVGLVYISLANNTTKHNFSGRRNIIRLKSVLTSLQLLFLELLIKGD